MEYRRFTSGKFRIALVRRDVEEPHEVTVRPWAECSREEKIEVLATLPALLIEITKRVNEKIDPSPATEVAQIFPP